MAKNKMFFISNVVGGYSVNINTPEVKAAKTFEDLENLEIFANLPAHTKKANVERLAAELEIEQEEETEDASD